MEDITEHFILTPSYFEKVKMKERKMKKKNFNFCILTFVELKCIAGETPILADLKYIIHFR